jgi:hypothetical protein
MSFMKSIFQCLKTASTHLGFVVLALALALTACRPTKSYGEKSMSNSVSIKLGEKGTDFAKRYPSFVRAQHQPAGIDFYEVDWANKTLGSISVEHGAHSFVIANVLGLLTSQDIEAPVDTQGFRKFDINATLTQTDLISHDEARIKSYELVQ